MTSASKSHLAQERAREREVYSYFPPLGNVPDLTSRLEDTPDVFPPHSHAPHASIDPVLTAFAQLGALRLDASRSLISLVDSQSQIVLAESTKTLSLRSHLAGNVENDLRLGVAKFPRAYGFCDRMFEAPQEPAVVINDLELDDAYASRPSAREPPDFRFYASVPLKSVTGTVIGIYSILDYAPRNGLDRAQLLFMQEMAATIVSYLSASRAHESNRKAEQMVRGLTSFVTGAADLQGSVELDVLRLPTNTPLSSPLPSRNSDQPMPPRSSSSDGRESPAEKDDINALQEDILPPGAKQMFSRAANIIRESCNLDGVVFFDASMANNVPPGESPPPSGTDDSDTEPSDFVESSTGHSSESNHSTSSSNSRTPTCKILGFADPSRSSRDDNQPRKAYLGLTEQSLRRLLTRNPHGKIFNVSRLNADAAPRRRTKKGKSMRSTAVEAIVDVAHNARSAAIIPLWDFERERWFAGCLCWVSTPGRLLSYGSDLLFLRAFGQSIMSELSRIESVAINEVKTTFIKSISHELRSPLHGILGGVEFLQNMSLDAAQADTLNSVAMCGRTLLDTVQNILAYSKINEITGPLSNNVPSGNMRLRRSSTSGTSPATNICQLTEETAEAIFAGQSYNIMSAPFDSEDPDYEKLSSEAAVRKPVRVILNLQATPDWTFRIRPGIWRRIVMNLVGNALKYTNAGFVRVGLAVEEVSETHSKVVMTVTDSGVGMSARFIADGLFKPFCQENSFSPGTGLGMSIVKRLVQSLGGEISVDSHVGVGTKVKVCVNLPKSATPINNAVVDAVAGQTNVSQVSVVRETFAQIEGDETQQLAHTSEQYFHDSLLNTLQDWFGTNASSPDDVSSDSSQLIIYPGPSFSTMFKGRSRTGVAVVVALDAIEAATLRANARVQSHGIEVITQPCGPIKLASILHRYLSRLDPHSNAPFRPDIAAPLSSPLPPPTSTTPSPTRSSAWFLCPPPPPLSPSLRPRHRRQQSSTASIPTTTTSSSSPNTSGKEVMIVDDNPLNLRLLSAFLNKSGIAHASAANGLEALQMFKEAPKRWAAVLMDLSMPVMDGVTATREIKAWERRIAGGAGGETGARGLEGEGGGGEGGGGVGARLGALGRQESNESTHTVREWRLRSAAAAAAADDGSSSQEGGGVSETEEGGGGQEGLVSPPDDGAQGGAQGEEEQQTARPVSGGVQIIVITGLGSAAARFEAISAGADEFMTKPIKFEALTKKLKERMAS
ncbi:hypothetical protein BFW01_g389 [Lasiodiplodia theobromae]|uniref:histidine kinase n=1 Tax=Lasiodiplodia theobromae TaxID=45133 RepID=A0A8H7IR36_9PEZI|nr:hypothetical protein BFW01_g389 [Lasiodiplodia theobromae]